MWLKEGAGKFKSVSTELTYWAQWGVEFVTLPLWIGNTHSEGSDTLDIRVQCVQCSAKRLALPDLADLFPSTVAWSSEYVALKKIGKELGNDANYGAVNLMFPSANSQHWYLLIRLGLNTSYVRFGFDWIIPTGSLTVIPFSCSKEHLRRNWHQWLRATKSQWRHLCICLEFDTSGVWQRD